MEIPPDCPILHAIRKVIRMSHAASALADSTLVARSDPSAAVSVAELFCVKNELRGFTLAFP